MNTAKKYKLSESQFNLWRAVISCCMVDGHLSPKEQQWLEQCLSRTKADQEQQLLLQKDLRRPAPIEALLPLVTEPRDFAQLIHLARVVLHIDGQYSQKEEQIFFKIKEHHKKNFHGGAASAVILNKAHNESSIYNYRETVEIWKQKRLHRKWWHHLSPVRRQLHYFEDATYFIKSALLLFGVPEKYTRHVGRFLIILFVLAVLYHFYNRKTLRL